MTRRNYIVLGDTTNHGGTVVSAWGQGRWDINGIPVACVGDKVTCPRCKGTHTILAGAQNPPVYCHGRIVAREGDPVSDGSVLMSVRQSLCWHVEGGCGEAQKAGGGAGSSLLVPDTQIAQPEEGFCLECWLKALAARGAVMADKP